MHKKATRENKISCVILETLTGSPGRPRGPTSPSSPWYDMEKKQDDEGEDAEY